MKKLHTTILAAGAIIAASASAQAQSSVTIYGRLDLSITKQNAGTSALTASNGKTGPAGNRWDLRHGSENRLGFRGVEDLGDGLKAGFQIEHRFLGDTGVADAVFWKARSFVHLDSKGLGSLYLGREYVPAFWPALKLDPWLWDTVGSPSLNHQFATYRIDGHARANNSIGLRSINVNGFSTNIAISAGEGVRQRSVGANLEYLSGPIYLAAAFDRQSSNNRVMVFGGWYDFKFAKPRLLYASAKVGGKKADNVTLAASVPVGIHEIKFAVARLDPEGGNNNTTKVGLGYEHFLSKRTSVYTDLGTSQQQGRLAGVALSRSTVVDFGLKHNF